MFKKFVIAYDHRVDLKYIEKIKEVLTNKQIEVLVFEDDGETNDYPILAENAHKMYLENGADGMILLCGTGIGMNIVANKFNGIRSVLATSEAEAHFARRHEDANCLVFGAGYADDKYEVKLCKRKMGRMIEAFVDGEFEGDRHIRRLNQIKDIENK
ncbi:MAG: RpiB/LacA/LacB family sugar-phosphate isomerase [Clostridia bacterium]|nr:RpiB/LacA/LacB family sugar-phosphate isomerase [Clostridia bacterium]